MLLWKACAVFALLAVPLAAAESPPAARARATLREIAAGPPSWVRLHAAETLIQHGEGAAMRQAYLPEVAGVARSPFRIAVWRVMAETAPTAADRAIWTGAVEREAMDTFVDPKDPARRLRAFESLGKLDVRLTGADLATARAFAARCPDSDAPVVLWVLALAGDPSATDRLSRLLASPDEIGRQRAAYALRWLAPRDPVVLRRIAAAAETEPRASMAWPFITSAALLLRADPSRTAQWRESLRHPPPGPSADAQYEISFALMPFWTASDVPALAARLDDPEGNVRIGAARSILHVLGQ